MRRFLTLVVCLLSLAVQQARSAAPPAKTQPLVDVLGDELPPGAIARLGTSRFRFDGIPSEVVLSADGKLAVVNLNISGRAVKVVMDTATGRPVSLLKNIYGTAWMEISRDGKQLINSDSRSIHIYDLHQGTLLRSVSLGVLQAHRFALSGDERIVAASSYTNPNSDLVACDMKTGKVLAIMEAMHGINIGLVLSHDGKWLASFGATQRRGGNANRVEQTVQVWETATGKELKRIEGGDPIVDVAFSPDGKSLAISTLDTVQVWDRAAGRRVQSWRTPKIYHSFGLGYVDSRNTVFTYSPDGKYLLRGGRNAPQEPAVWEATSGRPVKLGPAPPGRFLNVGFDNKRIVALGIEGQTLFTWDLLSGKHGAGEDLPTRSVDALGWSGEHIVHYAGRRGSIWDSSGKRLELLTVLNSKIDPNFFSRETRATLSPGRLDVAAALLVGGQTEFSVRNLRSVDARYRDRFWGEEAVAPTFSLDGQFLAVSGADGQGKLSRVRILHADSGKEVLTFQRDRMTPTGIAFDPTGKRLAIALVGQGDHDTQGSILTWRIDLNREDPVFKKINYPARAARSRRRDRPIQNPLVYSPDGSLLAKIVLGELRQSVQLYDGLTGEDRWSLPVARMVTAPPCFSPDSRMLAVASGGYTLDHYVTLWEMRTGKNRWYGPLPATPTALAFAPSGKLLVTGHYDSSALVWDVIGHHAVGKARTPAEYADLWQALASEDAAKAFTAQQNLTADRDLAVQALAQRLKPAVGKSLDEAELVKLVQQLDDDDRRVRLTARATLEQQGQLAQTALRKALEAKPSAELKRSAKELLARLTWLEGAGEELAALRAVEVLEWIGTPAARRVVETLARGWGGAELTRDAKATLARWVK